jgi:SAM-dependent methyltransferase
MTRRRSEAEGAELSFWRQWLKTQGGISGTQAEFSRRFGSGPICEPQIEGRIGQRSHVRILDVGAGPCTFLGTEHPGVTVEVVAVDPLADYYQTLLSHYDLTPTVRTRNVAGESLLDEFPMASFDFCYARNSLDHAERPTLCVLNMIGLLKPGGWLVLRHHPREGASNSYTGMHRWDFECEFKQLLISRHNGLSINLTALFRELCPIRAFLEPDRWCVAVGQRTGAQT